MQNNKKALYRDVLWRERQTDRHTDTTENITFVTQLAAVNLIANSL